MRRLPHHSSWRKRSSVQGHLTNLRGLSQGRPRRPVRQGWQNALCGLPQFTTLGSLHFQSRHANPFPAARWACQSSLHQVPHTNSLGRREACHHLQASAVKMFRLPWPRGEAATASFFRQLLVRFSCLDQVLSLVCKGLKRIQLRTVGT